MDTTRVSSFLPTIKCSMCAADIEISQMGDHVCGTGSGEPTPPPDSNSNFDRMPHKQAPTNGPAFLKPGRALPRVDTSAANRPFFPQEELTPVSASPSQSNSPLHSEGRRSPFAKPLRSATAPLYRAPPSPEPLSSNLDCAFPPFPITKPNTQSRPQQGGGYGSLGKKYAEPDSMYAPISPRTASSGGLLQRMNTIAPGPFDVNSRKASEAGIEKGHRRQGTAGSIRDMAIPTSDIGASIQRPSTAGPGHSRTSTNSSNGSRSGIQPPKFPRKNGYGGFGPPPNENGMQRPLLSPESRSQTFPLSNEESQGSSFRRPSEVADGSRMRRPSNESGPRMDRSKSPGRRRNPSVSGPDLSRPLPPRGASLIKPRTDSRLGDAPPVPLNLAAEFGIGNPYHTPNDSSSSSTSAYSEGSKASSRSSPPRSIGPGRSRRQGSDTTQMDVLMADLQSSMEELQPTEIAAKPSPPRMKQQYARPLQLPPSLDSSMLSPESPMDPAIQGGRLSPVPRNQARSLSPARSEPQVEPLRRPTTAGRQSSRPSTSKGNCKGCGEAIKGKSVSSADGRLTGRYHKQCFVCKTCQEPFQTSTFYVINDAPYCERHYHKLNGSVCQTCDKGIEGQYLESERKHKFHPGCLTCADCKRTLRNDYFEMNGRVYCERDAFRRAQQAPRFLGPGAGGSNRMERRTTRLMMM
ncbi:related to PXL1 LIM domain-containing protein that localizes to sites of polarized growth, required for selection and/or maintenance of polarized growth sites [Phialocephala subalpina]|uniref:Related to PXL1 LIM domain-containing protein that localizes to sites of polarized growth, required for selection and/or maintenance of polarized growth sites n=1 Tax=Phialocephala subalpina TaxID=576137 RepID=A0A1L7WJQ5_9HELO|nr:related to PXL1 LIM domain-containing protein that localizes to sites of polarized growth, required for selection and/or maintenance of polarized growth sites [Phialocephala subalpina]